MHFALHTLLGAWSPFSERNCVLCWRGDWLGGFYFCSWLNPLWMGVIGDCPFRIPVNRYNLGVTGDFPFRIPANRYDLFKGCDCSYSHLWLFRIVTLGLYEPVTKGKQEAIRDQSKILVLCLLYSLHEVIIFCIYVLWSRYFDQSFVSVRQHDVYKKWVHCILEVYHTFLLHMEWERILF